MKKLSFSAAALFAASVISAGAVVPVEYVGAGNPPSASISGSGADGAAPTRLYVSNLEDSSISVLDYATLREITRVHVGPRPYYVALSGDQKILAVSVEGEESIKFYDAATLKERGRLRIGKMYSDHMLTLPDGRRLIISDRYGNALLLVDIESMTVVGRIEGVMQPHNIRIGSSGRYAYATTKVDPSITVVDLTTFTVRNSFRMKFIPRGLAVSNDETRIYCGANWINALFEYDAFTGGLLRVMPSVPPAGRPIVQESTYHGLEFINDTLLLATNEGNSALDLFDVRAGAMVDRTVDVAAPGAILRDPSRPGHFVFSNMGNNTVVHADVVGARLQLGTTGRTGQRSGELPKRFTFAGQ